MLAIWRSSVPESSACGHSEPPLCSGVHLMHYKPRAPPRAPAQSPPRSDHLHLLYAHQKLGEHTDTGTRSTRGTVSSELKVNVQDVARLCSRKSHVKVGRRLRAVRRLKLGGGWGCWGCLATLGMVTVPEPPKIRGLKKERGGGAIKLTSQGEATRGEEGLAFSQ